MLYEDDDKAVAEHFEPVPGSPPDPKPQGGFTPRSAVVATADDKAQAAMVNAAVSIMKAKAGMWSVALIFVLAAGVTGIVPFIVVMWRIGIHLLQNWQP